MADGLGQGFRSGISSLADTISRTKERKRQTQSDMKTAEAMLGSLESLQESHPELSALGESILPEVAAGRVPFSDFITAASLLGKPTQRKDPALSRLRSAVADKLTGQVSGAVPAGDGASILPADAEGGGILPPIDPQLDPINQGIGDPSFGNMALTGINLDGISIQNPNALARVETAKTVARKKAELAFADEELGVEKKKLSQKEEFKIKEENRSFEQAIEKQRQLGAMDSQKKFFDTIEQTSLKPISTDAAKAIASSKLSLNQIAEMKRLLAEDPNVLKRIRSPKDPLGQQLQVISKSLQDSLGRMKSGGAINEEELKTFSELVAKVGPLDAFFESPKTAVFKLNQLEQLFGTVVDLTAPRTPEMNRKIQKARAEGATNDQIYRVLQKGGF